MELASIQWGRCNYVEQVAAFISRVSFNIHQAVDELNFYFKT